MDSFQRREGKEDDFLIFAKKKKKKRWLTSFIFQDEQPYNRVSSLSFVFYGSWTGFSRDTLGLVAKRSSLFFFLDRGDLERPGLDRDVIREIRGNLNSFVVFRSIKGDTDSGSRLKSSTNSADPNLLENRFNYRSSNCQSMR